ncbi:MAG: hypothetical protein ABJB97_11430 [Acidobacteriota bacterium]
MLVKLTYEELANTEVKAGGKPLVVYHGTSASLEKFSALTMDRLSDDNDSAHP